MNLGLPLSLRKAGIKVEVTEHAQWRAAERFAICHAEVVEAEIHAAFAAGRVSGDLPPGVKNLQQPDALYAWTPLGIRVYVLKVERDHGTTFVVLTVLPTYQSSAA